MAGLEYIPFLQLLLSMLLGMVIGVERSLAHKGAGMRTFGLVAMGSCFFALIPALAGVDTFSFDPFRVTAAVITGIGFLGGGLIIYNREWHGLTTAAGLWVAAGIGVAVGFQLYSLAVFTSFLTLFAFTAMWYVERFIEGHVEMPSRVVADHPDGQKEDIIHS